MVVFVCLSLVALASATPLYTPQADAAMQRRTPLALAPLVAASHPHGTIDNSYIVMLKPDVHPTVMDKHLSSLAVAHGVDPLQVEAGLQSGIKHVYDGHIKGYAGMFTAGVIERIREMPEVDYIERDQIVRTLDLGTERGAPWVRFLSPILTHRSRSLNLYLGSCTNQPQEKTDFRNILEIRVRRPRWRRRRRICNRHRYQR